MSRPYLSERTRASVAAHFDDRCAYCLAPLFLLPGAGEIEHIVPLIAGGGNDEDNLCLACAACNAYKGAQTTAVDPLTWQKVAIFHPRRQHWNEHFEWAEQATVILGRTACGRATIAVLRMNRAHLVRARKYWTQAGCHPPKDASTKEE